MSKIGVNAALKLRPVDKEESVLDLGCGQGNREIQKAISLENVYCGVDFFGECDIKHDFNKFPYPVADNLFDVVFCLQTLEHLENPFEAMKEMKRITRKDIVIGVPNVFHWKDFAINILKKYTPQSYGGHVFTFTWQNMSEIAKKLDLELVSHSGGFLGCRAKTFLLRKRGVV